MEATSNTKVLFYTQAYNAEKTIRMAMDSVLSQTYGSLDYYIMDNGSTDRTGEIVLEYMARDSRVRILKNEENIINAYHNFRLLFEAVDSHYDYFVMLDADDEYAPDFLEKALAFAQRNELDVICGGSDFIDSATKSVIGKRKLDGNMIIDNGPEIDAVFGACYQFFRTVWGKLIAFDIIKNMNFKALEATQVKNGADTLLVLSALRKCKRFGILGGVSHRYYLNQKSSAYVIYYPNRFLGICVLFETAKQFLIDKCSYVSPRNEHFLFGVYLESLKDALAVILSAKMSFMEKIPLLDEVFCHPLTKELPLRYPEEAENKIRIPVTQWLLAQTECQTESGAKKTAHILMNMYDDLSLTSEEHLEYIILRIPDMVGSLLQKDYQKILSRLQVWFKHHHADDPALTEVEYRAHMALGVVDAEMVKFLIDVRKKRPYSSQVIDVDSQLSNIASKYLILKGVNTNLLWAFSSSIGWVIAGNFPKALDKFISASQNASIAESEVLEYISLGRNIAAAADDASAYIYFSKVWISYLIDSSLIEDAENALDEFEQLLPGDEDFIEMRARLLALSNH